jgi:hypothetical protein
MVYVVGGQWAVYVIMRGQVNVGDLFASPFYFILFPFANLLMSSSPSLILNIELKGNV